MHTSFFHFVGGQNGTNNDIINIYDGDTSNANILTRDEQVRRHNQMTVNGGSLFVLHTFAGYVRTQNVANLPISFSQRCRKQSNVLAFFSAFPHNWHLCENHYASFAIVGATFTNIDIVCSRTIQHLVGAVWIVAQSRKQMSTNRTDHNWRRWTCAFFSSKLFNFGPFQCRSIWISYI